MTLPLIRKINCLQLYVPDPEAELMLQLEQQ